MTRLDSQLCTDLLGSLHSCCNLLLVLLGEEWQDLPYDCTHSLHYLRLNDKMIQII